MQDLVAAVGAEVSGREAKFAVAFRLGRGSNVADGIRKASDYEIEISDMRAQLEFVSADLLSEPFFARIAGRDEPTFALFGQYLTYHLTGYRQPVRKRLRTGNSPCASGSINPGPLGA
jgi:hypothetical protein